jgi:hypothetical protein
MGRGGLMPNRKGLGYYQRHMLSFCERHPGLHHIARDSYTRAVALSLESRGLIKITNKCYECWIVRNNETTENTSRMDEI